VNYVTATKTQEIDR